MNFTTFVKLSTAAILCLWAWRETPAPVKATLHLALPSPSPKPARGIRPNVAWHSALDDK